MWQTLKGGALLDKLSRHSTVGGNRKSREIYKYLQVCAAKPYYDMLDGLGLRRKNR